MIYPRNEDRRPYSIAATEMKTTTTTTENEPGSGGGFQTPEPSKLERELGILGELERELDREPDIVKEWVRDEFRVGDELTPRGNPRYIQRNIFPEHVIQLALKIKRTEMKIKLYSRQAKTGPPPDTSAKTGQCDLCHDGDIVPLVGCHPSSLCRECFNNTKQAKPIRCEFHGRPNITFDVIRCPLCRDFLAVDQGNLRLGRVCTEFHERIDQNFRLISLARMNDDRFLEHHLLQVDQQLYFDMRLEIQKIQREIEMEARRRYEAELRIEQERIAILNLERKRAILERVRVREGYRRMLARGEALPLGTVLPPLPAPIVCCAACHIPKQMIAGHPHGMFTPDVVVDENTRCQMCTTLLFDAWDRDAVREIRAEEERRVNDLYQAALVDQELHQQATAAFNRRAFLFAEMDELERPLRERLEQELLAAGGNERACERAMARFERELEEAQRKQDRRNRRR